MNQEVYALEYIIQYDCTFGRNAKGVWLYDNDRQYFSTYSEAAREIGWNGQREESVEFL